MERGYLSPPLAASSLCLLQLSVQPRQLSLSTPLQWRNIAHDTLLYCTVMCVYTSTLDIHTEASN